MTPFAIDLPSDLESERLLLGAMLVALPSERRRIVAKTRAAWFVDPWHREVWATVAMYSDLDGEPLWQASLPAGPVGWIFGAEGAGLSAQARAVCTRRVSIPIDSAVESLNVAAAAAVCLFERRRRAFTSR